MMIPYLIGLLFSLQEMSDPSRSGSWYVTTSDSLGLPIRIELLTSTIKSGRSYGSVRMVERNLPQKEASVAFVGDSIHITVSDLAFEFYGRAFEDSLVGALTIDNRTRKASILRRYDIESPDDESALRALQTIHHVHDRTSDVGLDSWLITKVNTSTPLIVIVPEYGADISGSGTARMMYSSMAMQFIHDGYRVLRIAPPTAVPSRGRAALTHQEYAKVIAAMIREVNGSQRNVVAICHGDASRVVLQKPIHDVVSAIVTLGSSIASGKDAFMYAIRKADEQLMVASAQTERTLTHMSELYDAVAVDVTDPSIEKIVRGVIESNMRSLDGMPSAFGVYQRYLLPNASLYIKNVLIPWLRWKTSTSALSRTDLAIDLDSVSRPTLWTIVSHDNTAPVLATRIEAKKKVNAKIEILDLPNTNHYMQGCNSCTNDEAENSPQTMRHDIVRAITIWLTKNKLGPRM